jgi:hypothetical protein
MIGQPTTIQPTMLENRLIENRRAFLKLAGRGALLFPVIGPLIGLGACSKQEPAAAGGAATTDTASSAPTPAAEPASAAATPQMASTAAPAAPAGDLPHLDTADPAARALGYYPDSSTVDTTKYPQHIAGQACRKCVQFKGGPKDAWGPCQVFAGKQVNANGWCTAFAAKV